MSEWLIDGDYLLEKFPGKGGWTYASIPEIKPDPRAPFGWVQVNGFIDTYLLEQVKLMPMGNGSLFLPLKASIRKILKKQAGDFVRVKIKIDNSPLQIPEEIKACLEFESKELLESFTNLRTSTQKAYLDWIYQARTEDTKSKRILKMMNELSKYIQDK